MAKWIRNLDGDLTNLDKCDEIVFQATERYDDPESATATGYDYEVIAFNQLDPAFLFRSDNPDPAEAEAECKEFLKCLTTSLQMEGLLLEPRLPRKPAATQSAEPLQINEKKFMEA